MPSVRPTRPHQTASATPTADARMNDELAGEVVAMARTENAPQVSVADGGQMAASAHDAAAPASRVAT